MMMRINRWMVVTIALLLTIYPAPGRAEPWRASQPTGQPTLRQRPAPRQTSSPLSRAPFSLTPQQQAQVDMVLRAWEKRSDRIKTFETRFTRREYDPVFGPPNAPKFTDQGTLKYAKPDKGMFEIEGKRPEKWISDGRSIYEFNYQKKQLIEHQLPPEMQGKAIEDGPIPFIFGAKAEKLKRRYFIRLLALPPGTQGQIWLEAYPRFQRDAANFKRTELILDTKDLLPTGIQIHSPNGKTRTSYTFGRTVVNHTNPLDFLTGGPFTPRKPAGWTKIVEPPTPRVGQQAVGSRR